MLQNETTYSSVGNMRRRRSTTPHLHQYSAPPSHIPSRYLLSPATTKAALSPDGASLEYLSSSVLEQQAAPM
ncbi:hypothetical protein E2C01_015236 [Portunus trituberculatus]|uniref:Uncharacterized protein n=1 Tax=Portunus trituberculatus TaxID=210409 RepID=A0A5B7DML8_PORTR|nr:hypothetical protein [Portunus trituberculatus]